jgi:Flp pilus assembly CpaE family ATPase
MGAAALTARLTLPRPAARARPLPQGLAFDVPGGPVVAVCGLVGGAGASTLALALAHQAAVESAAPVLLADAGGATSGLAGAAGARTPHSLAELAAAVADGQPPACPFVELASGLRLIAAGSRPDHPVDADAMREVLAQAREAHGLVVVDCGTRWAVDPTVVLYAHCIVWVAVATHPALRTARSLFEAALMPPAGDRPEILVARQIPGRAPVRVKALRRLACDRCDRLVLIAHAAHDTRQDHTPQTVAHALSAIAPVLRRAVS